jgi:phosphate-selective porin
MRHHPWLQASSTVAVLLTSLGAAAQGAPPTPPPAGPPAADPTGASPAAPAAPVPAVQEPTAPGGPATPAITPLPAPIVTLPAPNEAPAPPLAGFHNGQFYLRDANDDFRFYLGARLQIDEYNFFGPGVADTTLKSSLFVRRVRPELTGEILHRWYWMLAGDFGQNAIDNPTGSVQTSAGSPARYAAAQSVKIGAVATDAFIGFRAATIFNIQAGQFDAPFSMEGRMSDKFTPFMERSLPVRNLAATGGKEPGLCFIGETDDKFFAYSAGIFDGDAQNRPNIDNRADLMGRFIVHPLAASKDTIKDLQIGVSGRYGVRDANYVLYDATAMTTEGGYRFWTPGYGVTHVIPSGTQLGIAGELRVPFGDFDLTGEVIYVKNNTREANEGTLQNSLRFGDLNATGYYAEIGYWPIGHRDINGLPWIGLPKTLDLTKPAKPPEQAVQLVVRWEGLNGTYSGASRLGAPDPKGIDGDIKVNTLGFAANYWATKHLRLSMNYIVNMFPDSAPTSAWTSAQRAEAPGNTLKAGINDDARNNAHMLHELLFRVAVAL